MMSLNTIPRFGKSGMSRILAARSTVTTAGRYPEAPKKRFESSCERGEVLQALEARVALLRVRRAELRGDDPLQQVGLVVGSLKVARFWGGP